MNNLRQLLRDYGLSITLAVLFLASWFGQFVFQYKQEVADANAHGSEFIWTDFANSFLAATFENWQSEFLQLAAMVILTSFLIHKGSTQSKDGDERKERKLDEIRRLLAKAR